MALSCGRNTPRLQSGDLLFQAGKSTEMEGAITAATGAEHDRRRGRSSAKGSPEYTHVGIAVVNDGADSVVEAVGEGVRIVALQEFLAAAGQIGGRPAVVVLRLRDTVGVIAEARRAAILREAVRRARGFTGQPYDYAFLPHNGKLYCSELVWESFRTQDGSHLFPARPMNFRAADGSMPVFWTELFARQGDTIPQGVPGTNPNELAREPELIEIGRWF